MPNFGITAGKQPGSTLQIAQNGLVTYTTKVIHEGRPTYVQGESSADYSGLYLVEATVTKGDNGCNSYIADLKYTGVDTGTFTRQNFREQAEFSYTCSNEPIESHPRFKDFAGTPTAPLNGAIFDSKGAFEQFAQFIKDGSETIPNPFAGVSQYYMPIGTLSVSSVSNEPPSVEQLAAVGTIVGPDPMAPALPSGRNWLLTGVTYRSIGNLSFEIVRTYAASGPRRWKEEIYTESV